MRDAIDDLIDLYDGPLAHELYDEVVTELDHALQCAALATADGAPEPLVAAALLHDVGHLLLDDNVAIDEHLSVDHGHDRAGAQHLAAIFPPAVSAPVALHVTAKRYLCAVESGYFSTLSASSVRSLAVQGGPMSGDEADAFEQLSASEDAVQVRRWDDAAKVDGLVVEPLAHYAALLRRVALY